MTGPADRHGPDQTCQWEDLSEERIELLLAWMAVIVNDEHVAGDPRWCAVGRVIATDGDLLPWLPPDSSAEIALPTDTPSDFVAMFEELVEDEEGTDLQHLGHDWEGEE